MSNLVFPYYLQGQQLSVSRKPMPGVTGITRAVSGVRSAIAKQAWPRRGWKLSWEFLDDQKTRTNLCAYSADLTQWSTNTGTTVVPNQALAPDGTLTADMVLYNGTGVAGSFRLYLGSSFPQTLGVLNSNVTASMWLRSVSGTVQVSLADNAGNTATVTLTTAWQRVQITGLYTSPAGYVQIQITSPAATNTPFMVYAWGGQVEPGNYATTYIPTSGTPMIVSDAKLMSGFVDAMRGSYDSFLWLDPDFNTVQLQKFGTGNASATSFQLSAQYSPDGLTQGAYGYPQIVQDPFGAPQIYVNRYGVDELASGASRQNLIAWSQAFATGTWTTGAAGLTNNASTAPDGTTTGTKILETATTAQHFVGQSNAVPAAVEDVSMSIYVLPNLGRTWCAIQLVEGSGSTTATQYFNLSGLGSLGTGTAGANWANIRATITPANNGYYRITLTATKTNAAATVTTYLLGATGDGVASYLGVITNGYTAWGAQFEVGAIPTMYLQTVGGASAATTDYTVNSTGVVTYTTAPANNAVLKWSGSFYHRAAFPSDDPADFAEILNRIWELKSLEFESEIL